MLYLIGGILMKLENVTKIYNQSKSNEVNALKEVNAHFEKGKFYAIMGRSGSGKTTLINILGLMDNPTSGKYSIDGVDTIAMSESEKAKIRNKKLGFVFQSYYLESKLTALENVVLPTLINEDIDRDKRVSKAKELLEKLGLKDRTNHYPSQLSGGECQRVAIARSLINNPTTIIADEPTGNLDSKNEIEIFEMLKDISRDGKTVIVVSHNELIKDYADKILYLEDGVLSDDKI